MPKRTSVGFKKNLLKTKRIAKYKIAMEKMIKDHGYMIQGVSNGGKSFGYTIGLNDVDKHDFVQERFSRTTFCIFHESVKLAEDNTETIGEDDRVYLSDYLVNAAAEEPTRFRIVKANPEDFIGKTLGIFNRGKEPKDIKLLKIVLSGIDNKFEDEIVGEL